MRFTSLLTLLLVPATLAAQSSSTAAPKPAGTAAPATQTRPAPRPAPRATVPAAAKPPARQAGQTAAEMTDEQKTLYALGLLVHRSLKSFDLSDAELEIVRRALLDAASGKPLVPLEEWGPRIQPLAGARAGRIVAREKASATAYLAKAATETGAVRTESGLVYREVSAGAGAAPTAADTVRVHYRGTLTDGTEFDSSYARNEPAQFPLGGVIRCWTEGVQRMKVGGKARLVCPSDLAYGDDGNPTIPGGAALVFDIELLDIVAAPAR